MVHREDSAPSATSVTRRRVAFDASEIDDTAFVYYPPLQRVKEYVEANSGTSISLAKAAEIAYLERTYFSTFFHQKVGVCFREWLTYTRISRAKQILCRSEVSITEVALSAGFRDLRTFERAFKHYTGVCPSIFKRECRGPRLIDLRARSKQMPGDSQPTPENPKQLPRRS